MSPNPEYVIDLITERKYELHLDDESKLLPHRENYSPLMKLLSLPFGSAGAFFLRATDTESLREDDKCAIAKAVRDVKDKRVQLRPENSNLSLGDLIPVTGVVNYIMRNRHLYWCIPELRPKINLREGLLLYGNVVLGIVSGLVATIFIDNE